MVGGERVSACFGYEALALAAAIPVILFALAALCFLSRIRVWPE